MHMSLACPRGQPPSWPGEYVGDFKRWNGFFALGRGKFKRLFQNQWIGVGEFATLLNHGRQPQGHHRNNYHLHRGGKRSQAISKSLERVLDEVTMGPGNDLALVLDTSDMTLVLIDLVLWLVCFSTIKMDYRGGQWYPENRGNSMSKKAY